MQSADSRPQYGINRRQMIGGSALAAAGAVFASPARAADDIAVDVSIEDGIAAAALAPAADPALSYVVIPATDFLPRTSTVPRLTNNFGVYSDRVTTFYAPVPVPPGGRVVDITVSGRARVATNNFFTGYIVDVVGTGLLNIGAAVPWVVSPDIQTHTFTVNRIIGHGEQHIISQTVGFNSTTQVGAAMVSYMPRAEFVPLSPSRAYDSRLDMSPDANGRLASGNNRTISIADTRDPATGAVTAGGTVPPGARAVAYNITVDGPTGSGFLAVEPGGTPAFGASSINWDPNTNGALANGGIVQVDEDRRIKIFCGATPDVSAHFVVDITGYFR